MERGEYETDYTTLNEDQQLIRRGAHIIRTGVQVVTATWIANSQEETVSCFEYIRRAPFRCKVFEALSPTHVFAYTKTSPAQVAERKRQPYRPLSKNNYLPETAGSLTEQEGGESSTSVLSLPHHVFSTQARLGG